MSECMEIALSVWDSWGTDQRREFKSHDCAIRKDLVWGFEPESSTIMANVDEYLVAWSRKA